MTDQPTVIRGFLVFECAPGEISVRRPGAVTDGSGFVGCASPWKRRGVPDGTWYAHRKGEDAVRVASRHLALAHLVGGCPDCTCDPMTCETDDSGDSCLDCDACMHGCPKDECDMRKEPS